MMERYNSTFMVDVSKELFAKAIIHYAVRPLYSCSSPILDLPASDCTLTQDELNARSQGGAIAFLQGALTTLTIIPMLIGRSLCHGR